MQTPFLQTKLFIPLTHPNLISRPRLLEQLNKSLDYKLTLISAPAGYGKTTLVSSWIHQKSGEIENLDHQEKTPIPTPKIHPSHVGWVTLDERDNDPIQFWNYVVGALQTIDDALGKSVKTILESQQSCPLETLVTFLINDLAEFQTSRKESYPLYLILDDYHLISIESIHKSINFLIDHLPSMLHLIITTRSDPPLHLSRRQGRSEIIQIRASDLSFNRGEVEEFLNKLLGLNLSGIDITALENRTEGWIAGLQLTALSLKDRPDKHAFVSKFTGNDRYIADYLVDVVIQQQPPDIQNFLLQTSILDQLCAPLCNALTGQNQSQVFLNQLERANLFLTPLDNRREWYRYHQLFGDLLRQRLYEFQSEEEIARLHNQAYKWYKDNGDVVNAIDHAILAGDFQGAGQFIEQQAQLIFKQFQLNTLKKWIEALPDHIMAYQPKLSMIYAWALLAIGYQKEAEDCLKSIERSFGFDSEKANLVNLAELDPEVRGALIEVTVVRAVIAINQFNISRTIRLCQQVLPYLEDDSQPHFFNPPLSLRPVVVFNMGLAYEFSGEGIAATESLAEAVQLSIEQENVNILSIAMAHLGQLQILQGNLHQADKTYRRALHLAAEATGRLSPLAGFAEIGLGNLFYEWNDLDQAFNHFNLGITLAKQWNHAESLLAGYIGLARIKQAQGDGKSALGLLQELEDILQRSKAQMLLPAVNTCRARFWIARGDLVEATQWRQALGLTLDNTSSYLQENDFLTLSRLLIAQEKWNEAEKLASRLLASAKKGNRGGRITEILILQALIFQGQGKVAQSQATLLQALSRAEPEGYIRLFVDEGPSMEHLLYQAAANDSHPVYTGMLVRAFNMEKPGTEQQVEKKSTPGKEIIEPLSEREIEVLQCIAAGLSNREIAHRLSISLTTVKSHTRNIYGKLEVNSRTQAIAKGKAWGILPSS